MLTQKVDKKKNTIYLFVFIAIIIIIVIIFFKDRIKKEVGQSEGYVSQVSDFLNLESAKTLDSSFLENQPFQELKDNRARKKSINEINVGKENPFLE